MGDKIRIKKGLLNGLEGYCCGISNTEIALHLELLGYACAKDDWIEIIEYIRNSNPLSENPNLGWILTLDIENIKVNNLRLRDKNKRLNW